MGGPVGYSGASAIQMVRDNCDEPTTPSDATILRFLNAELEQSEMALRAIKDIRFYPTVANQTVVELDDDIREIISCNFSMGSAGVNGNQGSASPFAQGALVYPMFQLAEGQFMDAAAGFPAVGFGPPQAFLIYKDSGNDPRTLLPPPPPALVVAIAGTSDGLPLAIVLTYVNPNGETTVSSPPTDITPATNQTVLVYAPPGIQNATGYNVYVSENGGPFFLNNPVPVPLTTPWTIQEVAKWDTAEFDVAIWPGTFSDIQPPTVNTATGAGAAGSLYMQVYPAAMIGQVNVYAWMRPQLWADTTSNSWTNLDTMAQELVILKATKRTLFNRSRSDEAQNIWEPQIVAKKEELERAVAARAQQKSGQVRDVRGRGYPQGPYFWAGYEQRLNGSW